MLLQVFKQFSTEWISCGHNNKVYMLDVVAYLNVVAYSRLHRVKQLQLG